MNRGPLLIRCGLIALLLLPVIGILATCLQNGPARSKALLVYGNVGEFALTEASGKPVTLADLRGKVWIASFIFTHCGGSCPIMTHHLAKAQGELPVRDDLKLVSISVDPDRDTPAVLTKYAAENRADRSRWLFLTGEKNQIQRLAREAFKLAADDTGGTTEEPIVHSSKFVLVDRTGAVRGYYDGLDVEVLHQLTRDVERVLAEKS
jgi:protein SCO1/2